ncbi:Fic family protein [Gelidibacter maritimus]|uniref:Fic family protein n=1 Tax=Gelidibacter maritimus TaxID=2761487 RepID=A0A7W2R3D9_9FLAO|nr:Fic family protein [Gelidibacter maritimus]MBA6152756.1 Fic family protein [Gelidibacter maritimus]
MRNLDLTYREEMTPIFERLEMKLEQLKKHRPLPSMALNKIREALTVEWTYNSNSIEGNTLSLRETQMVLQDGITIKGKSLREHFEAKNHERAINLLYKLVERREPLSIHEVLSLHGLVMNSIEEEFAGRLRNGGVRISGANFVPPNAVKVSALMDDLLIFTKENPLNLNVIELSAVFHHRFVWIHPFFDGNGRTVRLAMNLLLMTHGFPPAIILTNDRIKYYTALNDANKGRYGKLMLLMSQAIERTLNIYLNALPGNTLEYTEISNLVEEENLPYGQEYISLLARTGKIDAYKEGRNWLTTKEAIDDYVKNRKRKR